MANRSDEVFIYLRAIGAAAARRDIEGLAKSLERLQSGTKEHADATEDLTKAQKLNADATEKQNDAIDESVTTTNQATKSRHKYNSSLIKSNDTLKWFNKSLKQQNRQTISNLAAFDKQVERSRKEAMKRTNQAIEDAIREKNRKEKVWRQTAKAREQYAKSETLAEIKENTRREKVWRQTAKAREQYNKSETLAIIAESKRRESVWRQTVRARASYDADIYRQTVAANRALLIANKKHDAVVMAQHAKTSKAWNDLQKAAIPKFKIPTFPRPGMVLKWTTLILGVLDLLPVVGTALNASLAGAIASVNGLLPMASLFGTIPGGILAMAQFGIVSKMVFGDIGKALSGNKAALDRLTEPAKNFVEAIKGTKTYWTDLRDNIQRAGLKGMGNSLRDLTQSVIGPMNEQLTRTAKILNGGIRGGMKYLGSKEGVSVLKALMMQNNTLIQSGTGAAGQFGKAFLYMALAAGPVLERMMGDVQRLGTYLADLTGSNINNIGDYFDRAYTSVKRAGRIIGNFGVALYNIFRESSPLTAHLADNLEDASKQLLKWTKSKGGVQAIRDYFKEMQPNLDALGKLLGRVVKGIFKISRSKNFGKIMDQMRKDLVPAFERLIAALDGDFILLLVQFVDNISKLADAGLVRALMDIGGVINDIFTWLANGYAALPEGARHVAAWTFVVLGFFGGMINKMIKYVVRLILIWRKWRREAAKSTKLGALSNGTMPGQGKGKKGKGGGAVVGGGRGGKGGGGGGSTVIAGRGKKGKPNIKNIPGSNGKTRTRVQLKAPKVKAPKTSIRGGIGGGAGLAAGAALAFGAPIIDMATGANKAMSDLDNRASVTMNGIISSAQPVGPALDGLFNDNMNHNFDSFGEALERVANPNKWQSFGNGLQGIAGAVTGSTTPMDQAKAKFEALDTALTNMPMKESEAGFNQIRIAAENNRVPMDKLLPMFPQLRDRMRNAAIQANGTAGKFDDAGFAAHAMGGDVNFLKGEIGHLPKKTEARILSILKKEGIDAAYRELSKIDGKTAKTYVTTYYTKDYTTKQQAAGNGLQKFAGGMTMPGSSYITGELGPELTVTRSGQFGMVGLGGQQMYSPTQPTAIIPASATSDPLGGNYGNAPDWARKALQGAVNAQASKSAPTNSGNVSAPAKSDYNFDFRGANFGGGGSDMAAVKDAVMQAIREAERDRRERR